MARPVGAPANSLFGVLEEWNAILRHTTLGRTILEPANGSKDGRAPRDAIRGVGRRRKAA